MAIHLQQWIALLITAFVAGAIDSIVGGGGLIQLPGLLVVLPLQPTVALLGTNKIASVWGTGSAAILYNRKVRIDRREAARMALLAAAGSFGGAVLASSVTSSQLKPIVLVALVVVFIYVWRRPSLGSQTTERLDPTVRRTVTTIAGLGIGFYDGFIGPGTGSFLVFLLVGIVGLDFLHSSATAKIVNTATNLAAIVWFVSRGHALIGVGLAMGAFNALGAQVGTRLALGKGVVWVRKVFLVIVCALIIRLAYDLARSWNK
jgi:uncharacterized protein